MAGGRAGAGSEPGAGAWPDIAVFGAGAVGCHYGAKLALAGAPVTLIGRGPHVAALGVPVPMNRALHALVRMLERERAARG